MATPLYQCASRAIDAEGDQLRRGVNWIAARRARLRLFDDHLECGDWSVSYADIDRATLYSVRMLFIPGYVLRVDSKGRTFHFGVNWSRFWGSELPFAVTREKGKVGYSPFSVVIRVLSFGGVAYFLWRHFGGD